MAQFSKNVIPNQPETTVILNHKTVMLDQTKERHSEFISESLDPEIDPEILLR